jgi:hypothetical protein
MEIEFHLVTERLSRCVGKHIRPEHLVDDIKRSHDRELLVRFRTGNNSQNDFPTIVYRVINVQILSFVEIHTITGEFPRRQHVENLSNVRLSAVDQLIHHVPRNLHLLPVAAADVEQHVLVRVSENLLERDGHHPRTNGGGVGSVTTSVDHPSFDHTIYSLLECESKGRCNKRLQLLCISIIRNADDGDLDEGTNKINFRTSRWRSAETANLGLLDQCIEGANTPSITRRHSVDFIHN